MMMSLPVDNVLAEFDANKGIFFHFFRLIVLLNGKGHFAVAKWPLLSLLFFIFCHHLGVALVVVAVFVVVAAVVVAFAVAGVAAAVLAPA